MSRRQRPRVLSSSAVRDVTIHERGPALTRLREKEVKIMRSSVFPGFVVLVLALAMSAGCATKRYGRMQPITDTEAQ